MNEVTVITPPSPELLDRDTLVKPFLKIDHTDEDALLDVFITSAREQIERWCGISIGEQVRLWQVDAGYNFKESRNAYPTAAEAKRNIDWLTKIEEVEIPYGPVISVDTVENKNGNTYSASVLETDYTVDGNLFTGGFGSRWKITYTAGYNADTLPSGLKLVWLQLVAYLYTNRQDESAELPQFIKYALQPYKRSLI